MPFYFSEEEVAKKPVAPTTNGKTPVTNGKKAESSSEEDDSSDEGTYIYSFIQLACV